jgi:hypothetical protein
MSAPRFRFYFLPRDWFLWLFVLLPPAAFLSLQPERRRREEAVRQFEDARVMELQLRQAREEEIRQLRQEQQEALRQREEQARRAAEEARAEREMVRVLARQLGVSEGVVRERLRAERQWRENEEIHRQQGTGCTAGMRRQ